MENNFKFIGKSLYLPKQKILVFGDLHLGFDSLLKEAGVGIPWNQLEETKKELKKIFGYMKEKNLEIKKLIILGDLKHYFKFDKGEKYSIVDFLSFLENYVSPSDIILIKGNHDTFSLTNHKLNDYFIVDDVAFIHGHKLFLPILDKKIKTIVLSHIHPSVTISEKAVKKEKFKAFLVGKWKSKKIIILPSFFSLIEGTDYYSYEKDNLNDFCFVPRNELKKFNVYVVNEENLDEHLDFGKFGEY